MKKLIIVSLSLLTLSGCYYQKVDKTDILKAEQACSGKGGIVYIHAFSLGSEYVACLDGTYKNITKHIVRIKGEQNGTK